ncbi:MAG: HAD-IA family hydrolase [Burkholderiaceae bacterium]
MPNATQPLVPPSLAGRSFAGFLFDMDGTILTSIAAAERVWTAWAQRHGVDAAPLLATMHGKRAQDTVRSLQLPGVDPAAEAAWITQAEIDDVAGIEPVAGAGALLAALPRERWAIVTSAPRALALRRIEAAGLPTPAVLITADDVSRGKPAPEGFLLGAQRLGFSAEDCLVFEDTPAGIQAAEAAGAAVMVISATHHRPLPTPHPSLVDYRAVRAECVSAGLQLISA